MTETATGSTAFTDRPSPEHRRPPGVDDATVAAGGKLSEALETIERARGHLYELHQLIGGADLRLDEAASQFRAAGHPEIAEGIERELIGRNVLPGRWTFQIVEEFDDGYYTRFREFERDVRDKLFDGKRHLFEAELKEARRTPGRKGHSAVPPE
ncbi:hypothetical protein [Nocardia harenae]|uniref:hypothetical protein n=1 Tax=Nocardia harenae TaxID=358707 RepID=UPI0008306B04|nr:hypothetical protein [Nocardia harenae]